MSRALPFYSPTPRRLKRPNHPNLFLLLLSFEVVPKFASREGSYAGPGQGRAEQGRAGQARAGQGRAKKGAGMQGEKGNFAISQGPRRARGKLRILAKSPLGPAWSPLGPEICSEQGCGAFGGPKWAARTQSWVLPSSWVDLRHRGQGLKRRPPTVHPFLWQ